MRLMRFLDLDGHVMVGEDQGDGSALVIYDSVGVLGQKQDLQAARALLAGRHAIVADDDPGMRQTMAAILERFDCTCTCCCDGGEALRTITNGRHDFVVSDIAMPDHDGYDVFAAAKRTDPQLPVVLVTGFGYDPGHSIVRASSEGVDAVLYKPFTPQQFVSTVTGALQPGDNGALGVIRSDRFVSIGAPLPPCSPREMFIIDRSRVQRFAGDPSDDCRLRMSPTSTIIGPGGRVVPPLRDRADDLQLVARPGLGVVIGTNMERSATETDAAHSIFGYTGCLQCALQRADEDQPHQTWLHGGGFDSSCPVGPTVTTPDELPDPESAAARISIAGREPHYCISIGLPLARIQSFLQHLTQRLTIPTGTLLLIAAEESINLDQPAPAGEIEVQFDPIGTLRCVIDR